MNLIIFSFWEPLENGYSLLTSRLQEMVYECDLNVVFTEKKNWNQLFVSKTRALETLLLSIEILRNDFNAFLIQQSSKSPA